MIFIQNRMKEFSSLVKVKNPSLLIQLQKSVNDNSVKVNQSQMSSKSATRNNQSFLKNK